MSDFVFIPILEKKQLDHSFCSFRVTASLTSCMTSDGLVMLILFCFVWLAKN